MKHLLLASLLTTILFAIGCSKKDDPATSTNPLLGHWEAESVQETYLTSSGQVQSQATTQKYKSELNVQEGSYDQSLHPSGKMGTLVHFEYQRKGDTLKMTANIGIYKNVIIRSLTLNALTIEQQGYQLVGSKTVDYIQQIYYHR